MKYLSFFICLLFAACSAPIPRVEYDVNNQDDLVSSNSLSWMPARLQNKRSNSFSIRHEGLIQNVSKSTTYKLYLPLAEFIVEKVRVPTECVAYKTVKETETILPPGENFRLICKALFGKDEINSLRNKDYIGEFRIPYLPNKEKKYVVFKYMLKVEDFK